MDRPSLVQGLLQRVEHEAGVRRPLDAVRAEWPTVPVILATGYAELPGGADVLKLNKPFTEKQLAAAISQIVSSTMK